MTATTQTKRPQGRPRLLASTRRRGPQGRSKVSINVELPPELLADIDILARSKRWTRTALITAALERMLEGR